MQSANILKKIWEKYPARLKIDLYYWFVQRSIIVVHASSVVIKNKCFVFLGNSGIGKSTIARLFYNRFGENTVLNDDLIILQKKKRELLVYGTPWVGQKTKREQALVSRMCSRQVISSKTHAIYLFQLSQRHRNTVSVELASLEKMKILVQAVLGNHIFLCHDTVVLSAVDILDAGLTPLANKAYKKSIAILQAIFKDVPVRRLGFKNSNAVVDYLLDWSTRLNE